MRISDLLDQEVVDERGRRLGKVHDVRLVQDARSAEGDDALFRVDTLLVGRAGLATRLGYTRNGVRGPWLVKLLATRWERRAEHIPWTAIERVEGRLVRRGR
ncbi:MAG TPA: PRC-barrel domain-containing protein [Microthrixaceae bacterium]|nr:PRC-barrel domain-containing protein [Microthrixaceae bacterium]